MTSFLDKSFSWVIIVAVNLAIILAAELMGGGTFFVETGLIHSVVLIFVLLIVARIFSDYAFNDYILKGFLRIQLGFFFFLGLVHVYEYLGLYVFMVNDSVVESVAALSYLLWLIGNVVALEFVFRIYQRKTATALALWVASAVFVAMTIVALHLLGDSTEKTPEWMHNTALALVAGFGVLGMYRIWVLKELIPVFKKYATFAIPAIALVVLATFSEYSESEGFLKGLGIADPQNLYLSHFIIYGALSLLLVAYGKLKRPDGIYRDM